jgi:monoterpene epsilon-lactone hydrolase
MPSKELDQVIALLKSIPQRETMDIAEMRSDMEKAAFLQTLPENLVCNPVDAGGIPAEWVVPKNARPDAVVLYLHGGGYVMGSISTHRAMVARIAEASRTRGLVIDYRLAPEHPFPAAVDDATNVFRWLIREKISPEKTVIAGDSAGGGLTLSTVINLRGKGIPLPAAAVCISPWTDLAMTGESLISRAEIDPMVRREGATEMAKVYLNGEDPRTPLASPLYADFSNFPPMLIQVGTAEILMDDSVRLVKKAKEAGVEVTFEPWPDMFHVWHAFADILPEAREAIEVIGKYISHHTE